MYLVMLKDKQTKWVTVTEARDLQSRNEILFVIKEKQEFQREISLTV